MQFLVYIIVYPFLWLISILPFRLLYVVSDITYVFIYHIIGYRKKVVTSNLRLALPDKSEDEIALIRKKFYHHLCDMIFEAIKSITISENAMKKRYVFTNLEEIYELEKENKSIICFMGHYASWEWVFILQKHVNHKGYAVYKRIRNKYFDALVKRIRAKYNSHLITTKETFPTLIRARKDNKLTFNGFVFDQSPKSHKALHWKEFMGVKVPIQAKFLDVIKNPKDFNNFEITDNALKRVEEQIYEVPEFYLWTHKRWKHKEKAPIT